MRKQTQERVSAGFVNVGTGWMRFRASNRTGGFFDIEIELLYHERTCFRINIRRRQRMRCKRFFMSFPDFGKCIFLIAFVEYGKLFLFTKRRIRYCEEL